jgi:hypothetical protein
MTVYFRGSDNSLTYDVRPDAAKKRWNAFVRVQAEMYARVRHTHPQQARLTRGRLGFTIAVNAELACAAGNFPLARSLAWDALLFAPNLKVLTRIIALLLAPSLLRPRFRKKWHRQ